MQRIYRGGDVEIKNRKTNVTPRNRTSSCQRRQVARNVVGCVDSRLIELDVS